MDCRRSLQLACVLLSPWSALLAAGCVTQSQQLVSPPPAQTAAASKKSQDQAKRPLQPKTCVALGDFSAVEAEAPRHTPAERQQLRDSARRAYQHVLDKDPKNYEALHGLARLYVDMGDRERAVAAYQQLLKSHPKEAVLSFELGMAYARWKQWEPALSHLQTALDLDPENRQCAHTLGYCLARAGRANEALEVFKKADGEAQAHYNLARMLHHLKQDDLSREHLNSALEADPKLEPARQLLAELDGKGIVENAPTAQRASQ
jgi:tetratricopeptide (TPR) repeat protein